MQKSIGIALLLLAYAMLVPGLTEPMLSVAGTVEKTRLVSVGKDLLNESDDLPEFIVQMAERVVDNLRVSGTVSAFDKTNSIIGTARELFNNNHRSVAFLIILFSVIIPVLKALLLLFAQLPLRPAIKNRLLWVSSVTSKWSMADVFVVAIFVAYLAAKGMQENRGLVDFDADLGSGFYFFLAYCLISILGTQLVTGVKPHVKPHGANLENQTGSPPNKDTYS